MTVISITTPSLRINIVQDTDPTSPAEQDNLGEIAYCSSKYALGTESVSRERLVEISKGILDGSLIGMPVWAYVHSGATIRAAYSNPFSCPWDSGQSGFVYTTKEKAIKAFGKAYMTIATRDKTLKCLVAEVEAFDQYLTGDVYGYIVEELVDGDWKQLDSCWGFYGYDYCVESAREAVAVSHFSRQMELVLG